MQIFVDADACPVVAIIEKIAKDNSVPVMLLCDTNHVLSSTYSKVVVVGAGADAVDYKLISICHKGDIVVSPEIGYTTRLIIRLYTQYDENLVLSAIAPETIVAEVAQKTVWKIRNAQNGTPSGSIALP